MKKNITAFVWILIFLNFYYIEPSHAQKKTFTCTVKQSYGGSLRLPFDTALIFANAKARRKVQKKAAVYWKSLLVGKNREVSMAELIALVKGIFQKETSLKTKKPPADGYRITVFAKIEYDDSVIESRVRKFNKNHFMFNRFMESQQREKELIDNLSKIEERYSKENFLSLLVHKQRKKFFQNEFHRIDRQLKAVELNEKALYLFPNYENTIDYWGNLALARKFMSKAIQLDPNYARYYYFRGVIYGKELFDDSALEDFSQAIRLDPNYADPYDSRAFIYSFSQQYDLARSDAKRACELGSCTAKSLFKALDICGE